MRTPSRPTSSVRAATSPPLAVASTPPPRASFASLPPELKHKVAAHVQHNDKFARSDRPSYYEPDGNDVVEEVQRWIKKMGGWTQEELAREMARVYAIVLPCWNGLSALSLVDRACYLAARPFIWEVCSFLLGPARQKWILVD